MCEIVPSAIQCRLLTSEMILFHSQHS